MVLYDFIFFPPLQDMQDMRDCYDSLLSAAAATANSAYGTSMTSFGFLFERRVCFLCVSLKKCSREGNDHRMLVFTDAHYLLA